MKLRDFIEKLKEFDPELPVCIADWQESCRCPSEYEAEQILLCDSLYYPAVDKDGIWGEKLKEDKILKIGRD